MGQTFELQDRIRPAESAQGAVNGTLVATYMPELDDMRARVARYTDMDPDEVLLSISALSGRLAEMRAQLQRSGSQQCTALRTREVDPLREELDLQFRIWSRRIALLEWEMRLSTSGHIT